MGAIYVCKMPGHLHLALCRRGSRIQKGGGVVQEFRLENRSYPDVHDFSLRMQVIIANANNIADSRRGGGGGGVRAPKKNPCIRACYE